MLRKAYPEKTNWNWSRVGIYVALSFWTFGCQQINEPAPFFDGLYFVYEEVMGKTTNPEDTMWTHTIRYRFEERVDGTFKISQEVHTKRGPRMKKSAIQIPFPQVGGDLAVDKTGIVLTGGDMMNFLNGYPSFLWLSPKYQKKGAKMFPILFETQEKIEWKGHEVWPRGWGPDQTLYYDIETGLLVGKEALDGKMRMVLVETNHAALKKALPGKPIKTNISDLT
jgi:hypothetical protein